MNNQLFQREKRRPGRKRTVTARAWISRKETQGVFYSNVSLGKGKVHVLSTHSCDRSAALRFNHSHLMSCLKEDPATAQPGIQVQQEFNIFAHSA